MRTPEGREPEGHTTEYDVVVVGGGIAGVFAAIGASEYVDKVLLVEQNASLGGQGTLTGERGFCGDVLHVNGHFQRILEDLEKSHALGPITPTRGGTAFDGEILAFLLQEKVLAMGVDILFHTVLVDVTGSRGRVHRLELFNKSGLQWVRTRYVVDCTGDGDLVAMAGFPTTKGGAVHNPDGSLKPKVRLQLPMSLCFWMEDVGSEVEAILPSGCPSWSSDEDIPMTSINHVSPYTVFVKMKVIGGDVTNGKSHLEAEIRARRQMMGLVHHLQTKGYRGKRYDTYRLRHVSPGLGVREGRRIVGEYVLTEADVRKGRRFPDAVDFGSGPYPRSRTTRCTALAVLVLATVVLSFMQPQQVAALEDGRIGVLYIGCLARSAPFWWMRSDLLFSMSFVQATLRDWGAWGPAQVAKSEGQVYRMIRLYMPRTVSDLTSRFDVIILANANRLAVSPRNIEMLAGGVKEEAMGLVMFGGWESFGGTGTSYPPWGDTTIGELLPTNDAGEIYIYQPAGSHRLVIDEKDHEFITSLPWDRRQPFMYNFHHNLVTAKPGASTLAHVESYAYKDHPGFVTWELPGGARTFAITGEIIGPSSEPGQLHTMCTRGNPWEYALDFGGNLMIYLDRRPVPQDIHLVHQVRMRMFQLGTRKSLLFGLLEFCDSFGANTDKIHMRIDEANGMALDVLPDYLELRFERVLEVYDEIYEMLAEIEEEAVQLKNRALIWVYVIDWLAVSGTAMVAGAVLWSTMVRRRLWREVGTTKLVAQDL